MLRLLVIIAIIFTSVSSGVPARAAEMKSRGMAISPLREEAKVNPGKPASGFFFVANYTKSPMTVDLSVQQFSVTDFVYDYKFLAPPKNDWIKLRETSTVIQPNQSKKIWYDIVVPAKTTPGGYYFSLFASTKIAGEGLPGTIQAASLLYLVVDGKLVRTSILQNDSIPFLVTGTEIPYKFDVKNTGNVHFSAYFYGQLGGLLFGKGEEAGTGHIIMPGTIKTVDGAVPTPLIPGFYRVTYGYRVDFADIVITKTAYILFIPPWSIAAAAFLLVGAHWIRQRRRENGSEKG